MLTLPEAGHVLVVIADSWPWAESHYPRLVMDWLKLPTGGHGMCWSWTGCSCQQAAMACAGLGLLLWVNGFLFVCCCLTLQAITSPVMSLIELSSSPILLASMIHATIDEMENMMTYATRVAVALRMVRAAVRSMNDKGVRRRNVR